MTHRDRPQPVCGKIRPSSLGFKQTFLVRFKTLVLFRMTGQDQDPKAPAAPGETTRSKILTAAGEVFTEQGYFLQSRPIIERLNPDLKTGEPEVSEISKRIALQLWMACQHYRKCAATIPDDFNAGGRAANGYHHRGPEMGDVFGSGNLCFRATQQPLLADELTGFRPDYEDEYVENISG